jgi:hypothetical protein
LAAVAQSAAAAVQQILYSQSNSSGSSTATSSTTAPTLIGGNQIGGFQVPNQNPLLGNEQQSQTILNAATLNELLILFGVIGSRRTLELAQIDTKQYTKDGTFFHDLKKSYKEFRGFWRYWFSVWRLSYCDFVKVS